MKYIAKKISLERKVQNLKNFAYTGCVIFDGFEWEQYFSVVREIIEKEYPESRYMKRRRINSNFSMVQTFIKNQHVVSF